MFTQPGDWEYRSLVNLRLGKSLGPSGPALPGPAAREQPQNPAGGCLPLKTRSEMGQHHSEAKKKKPPQRRKNGFKVSLHAMLVVFKLRPRISSSQHTGRREWGLSLLPPWSPHRAVLPLSVYSLGFPPCLQAGCGANSY